MSEPNKCDAAPEPLNLPANGAVVLTVRAGSDLQIPLTERGVLDYLDAVIAAAGAADSDSAEITVRIVTPDGQHATLTFQKAPALAHAREVLTLTQHWRASLVKIANTGPIAVMLIAGATKHPLSIEAATQVVEILRERSAAAVERFDEDASSLGLTPASPRVELIARFGDATPVLRLEITPEAADRMAMQIDAAVELSRKRQLAGGRPLAEVTKVVERDDDGRIVKTEKELIY